MFWFFGHEACGILAPRPGIEPTPPALEGEVLTTGPLGKSQYHPYLKTRKSRFREVTETASHTNVKWWGQDLTPESVLIMLHGCFEIVSQIFDI